MDPARFRAMSESWLVVVEQSIRDPQVAAQRAAEVTDWLLARGIVVRREPRERGQDEFAPGPNILDACPDFSGPPGQVVRGRTWTSDARPSGLRHNGVDVLAEWRMHFESGLDPEPVCPGCSATYDGDAYFDTARTFEETKAETEPTLQCENCGAEYPLGAWPGSGQVIGHLALEFHNWSDFAPDFERELRARMGERTTVMECFF